MNLILTAARELLDCETEPCTLTLVKPEPGNLPPGEIAYHLACEGRELAEWLSANLSGGAYDALREALAQDLTECIARRRQRKEGKA